MSSMSEGRNLHAITHGDSDNYVPSWSRDGKFIYFASPRTGSRQIWKHSLADGSERQLTEHGGFAPLESYDGQTLYYTKFDEPGIWSMPANGGSESPVVAGKPQVSYWGHWAVTESGLYLLDADAEPRPTIEFYSFATRRIKPVLSLVRNTNALAAQPERVARRAHRLLHSDRSPERYQDGRELPLGRADRAARYSSIAISPTAREVAFSQLQELGLNLPTVSLLFERFQGCIFHDQCRGGDHHY